MHRVERTRVLLVAITAVVALVAPACGGDTGDSSNTDGTSPSAAPSTTSLTASWRHFGGDPANTRHAIDEVKLTPDNVGGLEPAWEIEGIDGETGTPLLVDDTLYFGDWAGTAHAVDAATGAEIWSNNITDPGYYLPRGAAIDDESVYFGGFDAKMYALDRQTGDVRWSAKVDDHPTATIFGSPVRVDDLIVVGVAGFEIALDLDDYTFRGSVVGIDADTGNERWRLYTTGNDETSGAGVSVWSSPAVDAERAAVYIGTGNTLEEPAAPLADGILAIDYRTGDLLWNRQFTQGDVYNNHSGDGPDADVGAAPNLFDIDGRAIVGVGDKAGRYYALDRDTGEEVWTTQMTRGSTFGGQQASAAYAHGTIYVASNIGRKNSPHVGKLGDLLALDAATGAVKWRTSLGAITFAPVTYANGVVYVANSVGTIAAFSAESGERLWSHDTGITSAGGILVAGGRVYVGYGFWVYEVPEIKTGGLIAFELPEGQGPDDSSTRGRSLPSGTEEVDGAAIYSAACASCHGPDGRGGIGPSLQAVADRLTVEEHEAVVRDGRGAMPGFDDQLSDDEIDAVVAYERDALGE